MVWGITFLIINESIHFKHLTLFLVTREGYGCAAAPYSGQ